jgi:hypothetical protein
VTDIYKKVIANGNGNLKTISGNGKRHPWSE